MSYWQKNAKGTRYKGHYLYDAKGERVFVLVGLRKNGTVHTVTAESASMAKRAGWFIVK